VSSLNSINVSIWQEGFVLGLTPEEKFFYLYLLTNPHRDSCGCYKLPLKTIEHETSFDRDTVLKLLYQFEEYGKIRYDMQTWEILLINWERHKKIVIAKGF
jgi:hypothetical protein